MKEPSNTPAPTRTTPALGSAKVGIIANAPRVPVGGKHRHPNVCIETEGKLQSEPWGGSFLNHMLDRLPFASTIACVSSQGRKMQIEVSSDKNVEAREGLASYVESALTNSLSRFKSRVSRVEVHLGAHNNTGAGHDNIRCMMEARLEGRSPIAVSANADTVNDAINGAIGKLARAIESIIGKQQDQR